MAKALKDGRLRTNQGHPPRIIPQRPRPHVQRPAQQRVVAVDDYKAKQELEDIPPAVPKFIKQVRFF